MKVLHVISGDLWAGAEVQAFTLLKALKHRHGLDVVAVLMNEGTLAERLRTHGIEVVVLPESELNAVQIFLRLRAIISTLHPDIVHTHRIKENILGSLANALSARAPCVRTVHGSPEHVFPGIRNLHKRLLHSLDLWCGRALQRRIIAVSNPLAIELEERFNKQRVVTIENGVDVDELLASINKPDFRCSHPEHTHIGIVGRLVPVKRIDLFLEIASHLRGQDRSRSWRFHIFGDGPLMQCLKRRAEELALASDTEFHGHRDDIASCIAGLDVIVICSDHEGLPMTALESLALGTPIVAHAVGGLVDVLSAASGRHRLVREHTPHAYVAAVMAALSEANQSRHTDLPDRLTSVGNSTLIRNLYSELARQR